MVSYHLKKLSTSVLIPFHYAKSTFSNGNNQHNRNNVSVETTDGPPVGRCCLPTGG